MRCLTSSARAALASLLGLGACLSNPTPHPSADTDPTGGDTSGLTSAEAGDADVTDVPPDTLTVGVPDADVTPDGDATGDDAADTEVDAGTPFPPAGMTLHLRDVKVQDLDGDGFDDVLLTNAPDGEASRWGVWVMRGGAGRAGLDATDVFLGTHGRPDQVLRTSLIAGAAWDLTVLGATSTAADASAWLEIFPFDDGAFGAPLARQPSAPPLRFTPRGGTEDAGQPVILASMDVSGDGVVDLILGDLYRLIALHPSAWSEEAFGPNDHTTLLPIPLWDAVLQVTPITFGASSWLAVLQQDMAVRYLPVHPTGGIDLDAEVSVDLGDEQGIRETILTDVDEDGLPDVTTVFLDTLSVIRLTPPTAAIYTLAPDPATSDDQFEDVAVGDVDGSGAPDIVLLDRAPPGSQSALVVVRDPSLEDGAIFTLKDLARRTLPIGQRPRHLAVGRFDARGASVWTFDLDGAPRCSRWDDGEARLVACAP